MGSLPVQHDIVMEETSPDQDCGIWSLVLTENKSLQTVQKEHNRYETWEMPPWQDIRSERQVIRMFRLKLIIYVLIS